MHVRRLGLEWGAAYTEAQPIRIRHGSAEIEIYVTEKGELAIEVPAGGWCQPGRVFDTNGMIIYLPTND